MRPNRLRELFAARQTAFAGWMNIASPYAAELVGHSGFDAVLVDLQHGPLYLDAAVPMLQAISATPAMPMARCSALDFAEINKLLDAGAYAIVCPMIDTAAQARELVAACRYPPQGGRSYGPARGFLYGGADYFDHANGTVVALAMIETREGLASLEEILAVPGLDGVFVGPSDLSLALGVAPAPRWKAEPLAGALATIVEAAHRAGKMAGIYCAAREMSADMRALGYDLIVPGADAAWLRSAAQQWLEAARGEPTSGR